ncbi:MAG: thiamine diphosphokinase [Spirochaetaceae bacterium]|nr:MAG: thiamine diphosphokinase [Spirochaetaceae bacterium]
MNAMLFIGGGRAPRQIIERFITASALIAAADSGYDSALVAGYSPSLLVGDMDSISEAGGGRGREGLEILEFDADKDHTDTELLFRIVKERGAGFTVLAGGGSAGRMDHELGILAMFEREEHPDVWINDRAEIHCIDHAVHEYRVELGQTVSVFPVGRGPWHITSRGLKWPLDEVRWSREVAGVSNLAVLTDISVTVHHGRLLIVYPYSVS